MAYCRLHLAWFVSVRRLSCVALLTLSACSSRARTDGSHLRAFGVDDFGDTIRLAATPTRIASLNPTTTEILFTLGAGSRLVGRTEYDKWPDSARFVPNLGPGIRPNVEAIIGARPDLVLLYASEDNRPAARRLREAGFATASFKVDSIAEFNRLTRLLGRIIGDSARGALVADTVMRTLDSVRAATRGLRRPRVLVPSWFEPLIVIGGGSFISELLTIAGAQNVYDSVASSSPTVAFEDLLRHNPEFVLVSPERFNHIRTMAKWRTLPAVREGRLLVYDTARILRPSVRLGEGAVSLARLLHQARRTR